jgi:hypothetical protein
MRAHTGGLGSTISIKDLQLANGHRLELPEGLYRNMKCWPRTYL